jgi:hypothetical protein
MMKRFTVMGFTEAELGFVLAAAFAAVAVAAGYDDAEASVNAGEERAVVEASRDSARAALDTARAERERLEAAFARFRDSVAASQEKRSTKIPQCWERGEPRGYIAEVSIRGRDAFEIGGRVLTLQAIRTRFAAQIRRSTALQCKYVVRAYPTSSVGALDQLHAVWSLREYFEVYDRPR